METPNHPNDERTAQRVRASREELVERLVAALPHDGVFEPVQGIHLARLSTPMEKIHSVPEPSLCVIAQGSKVVFIGENRYQYDPFNYLLATINLPWVSQVLEASEERPYLSFRLELDPNLVSSVLIEAGRVIPTGSANVRAIDVSSLDADLLDAVVRLARLITSPGEARVLMPLVKREIIFRLLAGSLGDRLRYLTVSAGDTNNIAKAVGRLRQDFDQPLRIEDLAGDLGMSVSSFHQHFKSATALSPLQFQKRLRLQEARRLMLGENLDATRTAYQVGYNDVSHFNREYKKQFGLPPIQDIERLQERAVGTGSSAE